MEVTIFKKKINLMDVKEVIAGMIGIACLAGTIIWLCNAQNEVYQTQKDIRYAKAFFCLAAFLFVTQRVRLWNWQSLVASIVYLPIGYMYRVSREFAPSLFERDKVVAWIVWLLVLIAVDMAVYKKYTPLEKFNKYALSIYALTATFMMFYRNGKNYPIVFVIGFIFYLIPLGKKGWEKVQEQFCYAWLVSFVIMLVRSVTKNYKTAGNGRWYGDFLNIGDFGLFLGCMIAVILYKLYQIRRDKGRKNIEYLLWLAALPVCIWAVLRVCTITLFIGMLFVLLMGFIVVRKEVKYKDIVKRIAIVVLGTVIILIIGYLLLRYIRDNADKTYWGTVLKEGNVIVKPIASFVYRVKYMFTEGYTFARSRIFEPNTLINSVDLFTSGRLSIVKVFSENFNWTGNPSDGFWVGEYFAYNTHNTYSQLIYDYGYLGGGLFIFLLVFVLVAAVRRFVSTKDAKTVFACVWMAMLLGLLMGESANLYFPVMTSTLIVFYPIMVKLENNA